MANKFMELAILQGKLGENEIPVGAVVVCDNKVISSAHNMVVEKNNSTLHAEIVAINLALEKKGTLYLENCSIYVTKEPCIMCFGAIVNSRIKRVYFGAYDVKYGAMDYVLGLIHNKKINHYPEIYGGICEIECRKLLEDFFK